MTKKPARKKSRYPREWSWPNGAKIAVTLNMALESFVRASQVTLEKTSNKVDHFSLTYADYAYKAGAWRLLDLMDEFKIKGSVSTNGLTGERQPKVVRAFADFGCEIVGHGWAQDVLAKDDDPETELAEMRKVTSILTDVAGTRPVGWVSQGSAGSTNTLDFLKSEGYLWSGDDMSDDLPFLKQTKHGPIVIMPHKLESAARGAELAAKAGIPVVSLLRFGPGGDVEAVESGVAGGVTEALVEAPNGRQLFHFPFAEPHNLDNALAAVAAGAALGTPLAEMADRAANIGFSRFRGERLEMGDGIVLVNDCYNANPVSMRAALDHLASIGSGRRIAVLGEMAELGSGAPDYHREIGERSRDLAISLLIGVGAPARDYAPDELVATPLEAAELLAAQLEPGDTVLVKGSRSAGLEAVAEALEELVDG